jgi:hypothetical protein
MTFRDPILGGNELVRTAMQSDGYAAGVSGWRIGRDGSAEFNSGVFRGSLSAGSDPGQHFVVSNPATGDALDVYDSANHLIFAITNQGLAASYTTGSSPQPSAGFQNAQLIFSDNATPTAHNSTMSWSPAAVSAAQGVVTILNSGYVSDIGALEILCGSADGSKRPTVQAVERGHQGSVVVSDQVSTNNLVHMGSYSGTTNASGHLIIAHGCGFTPKGCVPIGNANGTFANLTAGVNSAGFTSTNFDTSWINAATGAAYANLLVTMYALLWG